MNQNPYIQKLQAEWQQLKADWQNEKAKNSEAQANQEIEKNIAELETQLDAAGQLSEAKLKEWSALAEQKMQETRMKFSDVSNKIEKVAKDISK